MDNNNHHDADAAGLAAPDRAHHHVVDLAPLGAAAAAPAVLTPPHKDEDHQPAGEVVFRDQGKANDVNCIDLRAGEQPGAACKRCTTLAARLALAGWALHRSAAGPFYATRWGMARELADLDAVAEFAEKVAAK